MLANRDGLASAQQGRRENASAILLDETRKTRRDRGRSLADMPENHHTQDRLNRYLPGG